MTWLLLALLTAACGGGDERATETDLATRDWASIERQARGQSLTMMMWQGDKLINRYMRGYVQPAVQERYGIDLNLVPGQGKEVVSLLMAELSAGSRESEVDLAWINGENFFQLRKIGGLYGPFVEQLPHSRYIDWDNPFIQYDFQQPVEGYECPWGNVQMALIYNQAQVPDPPMTMAELESWVRAHPGKFTFPNDFPGMTLLKSWLIELAGGPGSLRGDFDEVTYQRYSKQLWAYLNRIKPYFWNGGETFPANLAQVHQLFSNGELWFTMSNNDGEVDNKIRQGVFPPSSRAYVPETGSIQNSHYLGIVGHSARKAAAMVVIDFLISPEAQLEKMKPEVWGDGTILQVSRLPEDQQTQFAEVQQRQYAPPRAEIQARALMEPAPEYMIRLFSDFRTEVLEK